VADGYKAKTVQIMLRDYCTAHIREQSLNSFVHASNIHPLGFVTGKKNQSISWGALGKAPSSWISTECTPNDFEWTDPSHIKVGEIFCLLDHWRDQQEEGLDPLVWIPTCPLFQGTKAHSKCGRTIRQAGVQHLEDSEEEVFVLPSSATGGPEQEDCNSDDNESSEKQSLMSHSSDNAESINLDEWSPSMIISRPLRGGFGEHHIYLFYVQLIAYASCSSYGGRREVRGF
jgi:hypothetical protein